MEPFLRRSFGRVFAPSHEGGRACTHARADKDEWLGLRCVTQDDLMLLGREIARAARVGVISPTSLDKFRREDRAIGPNMYTVVDQYIKPLTKAAGGMSWALLRHPQGLKCDCFITHCWAEGAYEFIEKVTVSCV